MMAYATTAEYEAWTGESAPPGLARKLEEASVLVDAAILNRPLPEDEDGVVYAYATEARKNATVAQAAALVDAAAKGLDGLSSLTIGPLSMVKETGAPTPKVDLDPIARSYLLNAGLLYAGVEGP